MKAGTSTTVSLAFSAFPTPNVTLTFNGGDVIDAKRTTFKIGDNKLSFVVQKVQKEDAGEYTLTLENEYGKATATVRIIVLGEFIGQCASVRVCPNRNKSFNFLA
jgi:hypothetical protein